jgi:predicted nucleic acid-binding protein
MTGVFADTSYWIAIVNPRDQRHAAATALDIGARPLVTSQFVLLEVASFAASAPARAHASGLIRSILADTRMRVVPASSRLFAEGLDLFQRHPDKHWSLVDCTSFVLMRRLRLRDALTADRHFEQAGFKALLRASP